MISLAYIVKNEEKYISRSIESARRVCGEIVVLDAFSQDKTVEICKGLGAVVFQEEWKDDFSYARNKLLSYCKGDWVFMLDADEHVETENTDLITHAVNMSSSDDIVAWQLPRKNHYPLHDADSPYYSHPFFPDFQTRLFKRLPEIFFSGVVHEGVSQSIMAGNLGQIGRVSVFIHHHMFRGDKEGLEKTKGEYYSKLTTGELHVTESSSCQNK
jgi:glycosyltransferase involved in cell wall biosynthesis